MKRPKHLNLLKIHLPLPGVLSILHRVSGAILILALPFALGALHFSLQSAESYAATARCLSHPLAKLAALGTGWALFHHVCAGVRFVLLDFHIGVALRPARFSAMAAFAVSVVMTIAFGVWLWL